MSSESDGESSGDVRSHDEITKAIILAKPQVPASVAEDTLCWNVEQQGIPGHERRDGQVPTGVFPWARVGRYEVLGKLGRGSMGEVWLGLDAELGRKVALKQLRPRSAHHKDRLRREAQALARLSHPNVVTVYGVEKDHEQLFIAMELVEGQTLQQWQGQRPAPGWAECVRAYVQAGRGLAAAHAAGLVHRDFKPSNCMIDREVKVKVLDFGLVSRANGDVESSADGNVIADVLATDPLHVDDALSRSLTQTGTVVGTRAYMAPEALAGASVNEHGDQFSFCVSLYEAVYGERPYQGESVEALMMSVLAGSVRPVPKGSDVPVALRRLLLRGLSVSPAQRWPSMEGLLEELRRLVSPRRRRGMVLAVGLVAIVGGVVATQMLERMSRCTGARKQLEGAWDEERKQDVRAAILGTELSYAPGTWERVGSQLDKYANEWESAHTETCEATRSRGDQSEEDMSLRMGCLHKRKEHLRAMVDELAQADATAVENAVQAVTSLPRVDRCADVEALRAEVPPPEDRGMAAQVAALEEQLVEASAKEEAGKYEEGVRLADEVVEKGEALGYEPLMARAWLRQGHLREQTGDYEGAETALRHAYFAATARSMTAEAADASARLMLNLGYRLARHEEARDWAKHAEALSRAAETADASTTYLDSLGMVAESQGKYEEARIHHEQARVIREKAPGPDSNVMASFNNLGNVAYRQGKYEEARIHYERALAIQETTLGSDHPHAAHSLGNLGNVELGQGKYEEARAHYERALAIREEALGPDHPHVAVSLNSLGALAHEQGKYEEARAHYERALAIREKTLGPDHPDVAKSLNNLGGVAYVLAKYDEARAYHERALAIWEKALGPDHPHVASSLNNLSNVAKSQGKYDEARGFSERALAIREKTLGPDHPDVAKSLIGLGNAELEQDRYDEARASYERALAIREKALGPDHPDVALTLYNLGELAELLGKYDESRKLYERALAIWEKALGPEHPDVADSLNKLGVVAKSLGKYDEARNFFKRALGITEKALGPDHPYVADSLVGIGATLIALAKPIDALVPLERALTICMAQDVDPILLAKARFALAQALWAAPASQGRDRPRARTLAEQARDAYVAAGKTKRTEFAEFEAWLPKHRLP
jgi:tetratricopeptide (TPR) repeat protein/tRNA A-37 threonylcarbamoyl transferase component Bud32